MSERLLLTIVVDQDSFPFTKPGVLSVTEGSHGLSIHLCPRALAQLYNAKDCCELQFLVTIQVLLWILVVTPAVSTLGQCSHLVFASPGP